MSDDPANPESPAEDALPHAVVQPKARLSVVWLIPVVWLAGVALGLMIGWRIWGA